MKALVLERLAENFGGVAVQDTATPAPRAGEALVRIRAAGIGFPDLLMTRGAYQHKPDLPFIPGGDMAGEIVALGESADAFDVGDAVVATRLGGAFAEYGAYSVEQMRRIPAGVSFAEAAAAGASYLTAYVALVRRAALQKGEWVLVHGAAGGVGLAAVDLAKALGARVIAASASDEKLALIEERYRPDALINVAGGFRDKVKEITGGEGADVIYDPVGGDVFDESVRCIAFNGRLLVIGFTSGRIPTLPANMALIKGFSLVGVRAGEYGRRDPAKGRENMDAVWRMIAERQVRPHVHVELPLSQWREGFELMGARRIVGRAILDPSR
ncbi:MAG: NADPH:quinone oxidoreductase family protein [Hyphomonadaceae bacterium]